MRFFRATVVACSVLTLTACSTFNQPREGTTAAPPATSTQTAAPSSTQEAARKMPASTVGEMLSANTYQPEQNNFGIFRPCTVDISPEQWRGLGWTINNPTETHEVFDQPSTTSVTCFIKAIPGKTRAQRGSP
ncbi:MAG: hypothetical protein Q4A82_02590 [Corynebacterium sp.]|nr:hypothetical protein [Corynebacterium sp.]